MEENMKNQTYRTNIEETNGLTIEVLTCKRYWAGEESGKMEDMPGTFLDTKITLLSCSKNASPLEQLAAQHQITLSKRKKEITYEPEGYAKMVHDQDVAKVRENPLNYMTNLQAKVKKVL